MKYEMFDAKALMGKVVAEEANIDPSIVVVSTDSAPRTGMTQFIAEHPDRYYECGIAEGGAIATSAGLATTGKTPVFCAPAPFASGRPYEMFRIDLGYMHQNVKVIGRNCGFNYADLGPTHFGIDDLGLIRLIPEVTILAPADATQLEEGLRAALHTEGPVYLRVRTAKIPKIFEAGSFEIGKGVTVRDGKDVAIIATGEITSNVLEAVDQLIADGLDPMVICLPTLYPIDKDIIKMAAEKTGKIVTVEEHFINGGLGSLVCETVAELCPVPVKRLGVPMEYVFAGQNPDLIHYCGIDAEGITASVKDFVK